MNGEDRLDEISHWMNPLPKVPQYFQVFRRSQPVPFGGCFRAVSFVFAAF
jgi:hypothetical protein